MNKWIILLMMLTITLIFSSELTVYTYESMDWFIGEVSEQFERQNNCTLKVIKLGDAGSVLSRMILEKNHPRADVVLGLDQSLTIKALENDLLETFTPKSIHTIENKDIIFDKTGHITPFDFGAIALIYDPERLSNPPESFDDLRDMEKVLIIQDPRSSSTGQAFLLWTIAIYGEDWQEFWQSIKPAILTVTSGWTESFSKFEAGEAPIMVSYATDGAYSYEYYGSVTYETLIPKEGAYVQIEGVGIVKGTEHRDLAEKFVEFTLSKDFQREIPLNQWMFPVTEVQLPESFQYALKPDKILSLDPSKIAENIDTWLDEWEGIMY
ncbi:MAG: thiamine ABC transporter substrate-binding protein [Thermotogota bacterium]|nr:thiamine ABC transporter substrate-binding protein [Thermotogota bacterium]